MSTSTYALQGLHCSACIGRVTKKLAPLADSVAVTLDPMQVVLTNPSAGFETLKAAVSGAGKYLLVPNTAAPPIPQAEAATEIIAAQGIEDADAARWLATYSPLLLIAGYILGASLLVQWGMGGASSISVEETMRYFMAGFFLVFAFFKLLDLRAFADAYAGYDLLAARWHGWGYVYPFVELGLGAAYLAHWQPVITAWITLIVMGFSAIGVIRAVLNKTKIRCACLGTVFQLPMSTVTIVEDVGMVLMAAAMLFIR